MTPALREIAPQLGAAYALGLALWLYVRHAILRRPETPSPKGRNEP